MSQEAQPTKPRVRIEIKGRIATRQLFDAICEAGDADLGARKGEFARILLSAIHEGKPAVITGYCLDEKPLRLTDVGQTYRIPIVFTVGHEKGRNYGYVYATNEKYGLLPPLPMTEYGPAVPPHKIEQMLKANPFDGLAEISRGLKYYDADNYPNLTMPRALQVELMPDEKISLFAGLRR